MVTSQCLPRIEGFPPIGDWVHKTKISTWYYHESTEIIMSSKFPTGFTVNQCANYKMVGVGLRFHGPRIVVVVEVITLIASPKSTSTFGISIPLIFTVKIGFPGSPYVIGVGFQNIMFDNFLIT